MFNLLKRYDDFIGLTAVKEAQAQVIAAENAFTSRQESRRQQQDKIKQIQMRLKEIHSEFDKTSRGEDRYLQLLTEEHSIIKEEKNLLNRFKELEDDERRSFHCLSACLRESHEQERERGERTKYWSIIGSVLGTMIGILGTTISNRLRMKELRNLIVSEAGDPSRLRVMLTELNALVHTQQQHVASFIDDIKGLLSPDSPRSPVSPCPCEGLIHDEHILRAIGEQSLKLDSELDQLKGLIAGGKAESSKIVYVGPDMECLLNQTERNLERKLKLQTVANVVFIYTALAVTVPVIYSILRDT